MAFAWPDLSLPQDQGVVGLIVFFSLFAGVGNALQIPFFTRDGGLLTYRCDSFIPARPPSPPRPPPVTTSTIKVRRRRHASGRRGRALLGSEQSPIPSCAKIPPRPKSSDSVSCNGHGWCHEGTTASGNKPHCDCNAGYGGSHCETKILNLEDLSIKVADIEEEMEKMAESAVETIKLEEQPLLQAAA